MIDLHYWPTPNGWKISIMLEECGLPYRLVPVNIARGEQFRPEFLAISPNNRMPALVDHAPEGGGPPLAVFESGAILEYLAEKSGRFLPRELRARYDVLQWVTWQVANLGPIAGQVAHFCNYAKEPVPYAIERYRGELERLFAVLDRRLEGRAYVAGDYSIADIASFSWVRGHRQLGVDLGPFPEVRRWHDEVATRPGVIRGVEVGQDLQSQMLDDEARKHLFGQSAATVARS